jgi:hypothetical protein
MTDTMGETLKVMIMAIYLLGFIYNFINKPKPKVERNYVSILQLVIVILAFLSIGNLSKLDISFIGILIIEILYLIYKMVMKK